MVDFADPPTNDLSKPSAWNQLYDLISVASAFGIDLPCNTWSRARRAPPWSKLPKPLRSHEHLFGLPTLSERDQISVNKANCMFFGAIRCIQKCLHSNVPGYLENPANSWVWQTPQIAKLLRNPKVCLVRVDMCQYSLQWKKPTKLLFWNVHPCHFKVCQGYKLCSRTHRKHIQLTGVANKKFLTQQAQVYSKQFSEALMLSFCSP